MTKMRLEEDLLGQKEVPEEAYYGVHTVRAIENFKISITKISDIPDFIKGMVWVKKAAALTNKELHVLPQDIADYIMQACDLILQEGKCLEQFPVDVFQGGAGTSVNMNTNEVIANLALEIMGKPKGSYNIIHPNDHVNKSQSTNCAYPTGLHIAIYKRVLDLISHMESLAESFLELSKKYKDTIKMGRTQLQDAVPMTSGQEFYAFYSLLQGEIKNLRSVGLSILEVNLGATAIGTSINAAPGFSKLAIENLTKLTGFPCIQAEDLIEATSDCGSYVTLHGAIKGFAVKLSKICNDLRLLASGPRTGLKEINLPEMQAGSSIMPAKVNPVIPEVVNQICFKVIGNDMTITLAAEAGQLQLNVMEPVIAQAMFESISLLINGLDTLRTKCIDGITVNTEICKRFVEKSIGLVTYLNPILGHHMGDIIGKECAATGKTVREIVLEKHLLSETELDDIFSVENLLHPKYMGKKY